MTIVTPSEVLRIAPAPTCNGGDDWVRCGRIAEYRVGVIRSCGCGDIAVSYSCADHVSSPCFDCGECGALDVVRLSEPVRLRGAASDGRTE